MINGHINIYFKVKLYVQQTLNVASEIPNNDLNRYNCRFYSLMNLQFYETNYLKVKNALISLTDKFQECIINSDEV